MDASEPEDEPAAGDPDSEELAVLDNPVWHALAARQGHLGSVGDLAGCFDPEVSPFGGFADRPSTVDAWQEMEAFAGSGGSVAVVEDPGWLAPGWSETWTVRVVQMVGARGRRPNRLAAAEDGSPPIVPLGPEDVSDMLGLTGLVRPGPFLARTVEFGGYLGIRRNGRLVAMAGERLRPPGFAEISAVSTHPDERRAGLGARMVEAVAERILERGDRPFLHVAHDNDSAIRLYSALGFERRREFVFRVLEGPDAPR